MRLPSLAVLLGLAAAAGCAGGMDDASHGAAMQGDSVELRRILGGDAELGAPVSLEVAPELRLGAAVSAIAVVPGDTILYGTIVEPIPGVGQWSIRQGGGSP